MVFGESILQVPILGGGLLSEALGPLRFCRGRVRPLASGKHGSFELEPVVTVDFQTCSSFNHIAHGQAIVWCPYVSCFMRDADYKLTDTNCSQPPCVVVMDSHSELAVNVLA